MISEGTLRQTKILSRVAPKNIVDRKAELEKLRRHAFGETDARGLLFLSAPARGASELLRQTFDYLFNEQDETIPFYFSIKKTDKTVKNCALRFLQTFLTQTIAFRRKDAKLLDASPEIGEIAELAAATEDFWIERFTRVSEQQNAFADERAFVRNCLSAPLRAAAHDARVFVIIDNLQEAENLTGETDLVEELKAIYSRSTVQFVFAGRRRFVLKAAQSGSAQLPDAEILRIETLPLTEAENLTENFAEKYNVEINEQTRDLLVRQFDSSPVFIEAMFIAARRREMNLDSFQKVQQVYADELFGGRIGKFFDTLFYENAPDFKFQKRIVNLLHKISADEDEEKSRITTWRKYFRVASDEEFYRMMRRLHADEFINLSSGIIEPEDENLPLSDYLESRYLLEILKEQRAQVVGNFLAKSLKRASQIMTRFYRRRAALDLREIFAVFNCQSIPESLIDYGKFKENHKGTPEEEILEKAKSEAGKINLPEIVFTAYGAAFYQPIKHIADEERSAVGIGFESADYREENEIAWIAAEIDSKLEASRETAEFWCDRLEMLALACNFQKFKLWLIAPEGFAPDALEILNQRNAFGSSRGQIKILAKFLEAEDIVREKRDSNEYEMVIPMGDDTELIAAHAVEEIARRYNFKPKAITQIKTALVEACINASEHSLSPDRKIYQKFAVEDDKIKITISNRGVKIPFGKTAETTTQIEPNEGRRGWGLKLMRTLMDEVKFEQVDDGTRISMVKYLK